MDSLMKITGLYSGRTSFIGPKSSPTGIIKHARNTVDINSLGIVDDIQVDKRFHGGPERALHQFSLLSYQKIIQRFPLLHQQAWPGTIGENISAPLMHEDNVCIGDIYSVGSIIMQVSSPRIPCWKIDEKFKQANLHVYIRQHQLSGWYYRVLQDGRMGMGDKISLVERLQPQLTIRYFLTQIDRQPKDKTFLDLVRKAKELDPNWRDKLTSLQQQY
jgi:MOSC domain-containing protein YiiM